MSNLLRPIPSLLLVLFLTLMTACGGGNASQENAATPPAGETSTQPAQAADEYTSAYVCPMHCEGSGSDQPGKCPSCGMDYVALADHKSDGHSHEGHSH